MVLKMRISCEMISLSNTNDYFFSPKTFFTCLYDIFIDSRSEINDIHRTNVDCTTAEPP